MNGTVYARDLPAVLERLSKEYDFQYRVLDENGKTVYGTRHPWRASKSDKKQVAKKLAVIMLILIISSIFFLYPNVNGNVIGYHKISNSIGACLLIIGIVVGFFWVRSQKN